MREIVATIAVGGWLAVQAQSVTLLHEGTGGSPHVRLETTVRGARLSLEYGRPHLKGRPLSSLAPTGRVWRTGADEATTLITDRALQFGAVRVPAGRYTLYTIPGEREWLLVINAQTGQWGTRYDESRDLGRLAMKLSAAAMPMEQLTISIAETADGGAIALNWGTVIAVVEFRVLLDPLATNREGILWQKPTD
jgi:hypothetical protein